MRHLIVLIFSFLLSFNACYAAYEPIPANLSKQYKAEMERIIQKEVIKAKQEADRQTMHATRLYNKIMKYNLDNSSDAYINMTNTQEIVIPFVVATVYSEMLKATAAYSPVVVTQFGTDDYSVLEEEMLPYLKANNVDTQPIIELEEYVHSKYLLIQSYADKVRKIDE